MGLKMKNVNIMGVHQFLGEGGHKKTIYIYGKLPKRGGLGQFTGDLAKNRKECVFVGGWYLDAHYDLILVSARTSDRTCWCERIEFWSIFPEV